jgi:hypothetical protein
MAAAKQREAELVAALADAAAERQALVAGLAELSAIRVRTGLAAEALAAVRAGRGLWGVTRRAADGRARAGEPRTRARRAGRASLCMWPQEAAANAGLGVPELANIALQVRCLQAASYWNAGSPQAQE